MGLVRRIQRDLNCKVVCTLQGEDAFLDSLLEPHRQQCWQALAERAAEADGFVAPSRYFGELMCRRLGLGHDKLRVVYNGIKLDGYDAIRSNAPAIDEPPVLGFFARMCREKGLDTLVDAFIRIRHSGRVRNLQLRVGGSCGPSDQPLVDELKSRLEGAGLAKDVTFKPNVSREEKVEFLRSLQVFSVPSRAGEAFGLYVIEALAAGVPIVQPRAGAFPEIVELTGGGLLCAPEDPEALARGIEELLLDPAKRRVLAQNGRDAVSKRFSARAMAEATVEAYRNFAR
jgi:glycosyltransferase involved in cell wall biosynthesis